MMNINLNSSRRTSGMEAMLSTFFPGRAVLSRRGEGVRPKLHDYAGSDDFRATNSRLKSAIHYGLATVAMAAAAGSLLVAFNYRGMLGELLAQWVLIVIG